MSEPLSGPRTGRVARAAAERRPAARGADAPLRGACGAARHPRPPRPASHPSPAGAGLLVLRGASTSASAAASPAAAPPLRPRSTPSAVRRARGAPLCRAAASTASRQLHPPCTSSPMPRRCSSQGGAGSAISVEGRQLQPAGGVGRKAAASRAAALRARRGGLTSDGDRRARRRRGARGEASWCMWCLAKSPGAFCSSHRPHVTDVSTWRRGVTHTCTPRGINTRACSPRPPETQPRENSGGSCMHTRGVQTIIHCTPRACSIAASSTRQT